MVSRIASATFTVALLSPALALDLTPQIHISELEGTRCEVTAFRNGSGLVTWQPPHHWRLAGNSQRLSLFPPGVSQAEAIVEVLERPASPTLNEAFGKALKQQIAASLPKDAIALAWGDDEANPLLMNQNPTYKVTGTHTLFGQRFARTTWICNFAELQVRFHLTSRDQDFAKLHEAFRESLYTWQGLK